MLAVLQFIFGDFWRYLGCCVFLMIFVMWQPIKIESQKLYQEDDEDE